MNKTYLENYAELAVKIGAGVKKGQPMLITASPEDYEMARMVCQKCYEAGATDVHILYADDFAKHALLEFAPEEILKRAPEGKLALMLDYLKRDCAIIHVYSARPDLLADIAPERANMHDIANRMAQKDIMEQYVMSGKTRWTLVNMSNADWAKKVFPELSEEEAIEKLWDNIFACTRADQKDPIAAWEKHLENLDEKKAFLNEKHFDKLIYKAPGTDLEVGLVDGHLWLGGRTIAQSGDPYLPNIPTEEVFTTPHRDRVNGTLRSTLPLSYNGKIINGFSFTFKDGKIVDYSAEEGYETLKDMISIDEGAKFLGEVALVPYDSPISNTGLTYFSTLYDENASCHFAVGGAYLLSVKNGPSLTEEEKKEQGVNTSLTHVDFMVGSPELDIIGVTHDGEEIQIFKDGDWAF